MSLKPESPPAHEPSWLHGDKTSNSSSSPGVSVPETLDAPPPTTEYSTVEPDYDPSKPSWATDSHATEATALILATSDSPSRTSKVPKKQKRGGVRGAKDIAKDRAKDIEQPAEDSEDQSQSEAESLYSDYSDDEHDPLQRPPRSPLHSFFVTLSILTTATSLLLLTSLSITLYYRIQSLTPVQIIVRIYSAAFAIVVVLTEWSLPGGRTLAESWLAKGLFYVYIGVVEEEELIDGIDIDEIKDSTQIRTFYHVIVSTGSKRPAHNARRVTSGVSDRLKTRSSSSAAQSDWIKGAARCDWLKGAGRCDRFKGADRCDRFKRHSFHRHQRILTLLRISS